MERLNARLTLLVWRMRGAALLRRLSVCVLWALAVAAAAVALDKLVYLGLPPLVTAGLLVGAGCVAGLVMAFGRDRVTRLRAAMEADRALRLDNRLASALELSRSDGPWARAVADDARRQAGRLRPADVCPLAPTLAARLLIPAAIGLWLLTLVPPADLFGRLARRAKEHAAAEEAGRRVERALAAAGAGPGGAPGAETPAGQAGPPGLRVELVRIERRLLAGQMDPARQMEFGRQLQELANQLAARRAGRDLTDAIRHAADALARGDKEAAAKRLAAAQRELARLERELKAAASATGDLAELLARERAALREAEPFEPARTREPEAAEPSEDLVELAPAPGTLGPAPMASGIVYSPAATGTPSDGAPDHAAAVRAADALIESGTVPPGYARLVRGYFDAIRPAHD